MSTAVSALQTAAVPDTFPADIREADGVVGGVATHVSSVAFSDHVVVTVSQDGRLAQWVRAPRHMLSFFFFSNNYSIMFQGLRLANRKDMLASPTEACNLTLSL